MWSLWVRLVWQSVDLCLSGQSRVCVSQVQQQVAARWASLAGEPPLSSAVVAVVVVLVWERGLTREEGSAAAEVPLLMRGLVWGLLVPGWLVSALAMGMARGLG